MWDQDRVNKLSFLKKIIFMEPKRKIIWQQN